MTLERAARLFYDLGNVGRSPEELLQTNPTMGQWQEAKRKVHNEIILAIFLLENHFKKVDPESYHCGHNVDPKMCKEKICGYRDLLDKLERSEALGNKNQEF